MRKMELSGNGGCRARVRLMRTVAFGALVGAVMAGSAWSAGGAATNVSLGTYMSALGSVPEVRAGDALAHLNDLLASRGPEETAAVRRATMAVAAVLKDAGVTLSPAVAELKPEERDAPLTVGQQMDIGRRFTDLIVTLKNFREKPETLAPAHPDAAVKALFVLAADSPLLTSRIQATSMLLASILEVSEKTNPDTIADRTAVLRLLEAQLAALEKAAEQKDIGLDEAAAMAGLSGLVDNWLLRVLPWQADTSEKDVTDRLDRVEVMLMRASDVRSDLSATLARWKQTFRPYVQGLLGTAIAETREARAGAQVVADFMEAVEKGNKEAALKFVEPARAADLQKAEPMAAVLGKDVRHVTLKYLHPNGKKGTNPTFLTFLELKLDSGQVERRTQRITTKKVEDHYVIADH